VRELDPAAEALVPCLGVYAGAREGEIVLHGILWGVEPEGFGGPKGVPQIGRGARDETQSLAADAEHVEVEGDEETGGIDPRPTAGIDAVLAHEPSKEEKEPLAGAAARRIGQEILAQRP
jgi:hypothetical protein